MSTFMNPAPSADLTAPPDLDAAFELALSGEEVATSGPEYDGNNGGGTPAELNLPFGQEDESQGAQQAQSAQSTQPGQAGQQGHQQRSGQQPASAQAGQQQPTGEGEAEEDLDVLFDLVGNDALPVAPKSAATAAAQPAQSTQPAQPAQPTQPPAAQPARPASVIDYNAPLLAPAAAKQVHDKYVTLLREYATTGDASNLEQFQTDLTRLRVTEDPVIGEYIQQQARAIVEQMITNDPRLREVMQVTSTVSAQQLQQQALGEIRAQHKDFDQVLSAKARVRVVGEDGKPVVRELPMFQAIKQAHPDIFRGVILGPDNRPDPKATKLHHLSQAYRLARRLTASTRTAIATGAEAGATQRATTPSGSTTSRRNAATPNHSRPSNDLTEDLRPFMAGNGRLPFGQ